ncbi:glycosyltransferase [Mucilaginibacter sp. OK098]|uniref:glycosyltransferase n=1 Tax=Mucilaginibacter sp. OK098 TaxID=1855297 RepID=UPI00091A3F0A|nr:nucleotide disphospho-sugar-binding domain-containing protein [Mucilaginibacter sp. OK098]SHN36094.1 UDP:flavonoid glycosyltransferase YjiC, YdhE family [Mucilaginibacter sp. OK098]
MVIRALFIPNPMPSHIIPLIALAKQLNTESFETAFLLPAAFHKYVRKFNLKVLEIDRRLQDKTTPELIAFSKFKPDLVVDDLNYTTAFSTRFAGIPRVSVVRRGIIPYEKNTPGYQHSSEAVQFLDAISKLDLPGLGMWKPDTVADLFVGDLNIIPSIPSIEELPDELKQDNSYVYSGALTLSDNEIMENLTSLSEEYKDNQQAVKNFIDKNSERQVIYFTHGLTEPTEITGKAHSVVKLLLDRGAAVITNLQGYNDLNGEQKGRFFSAMVLPMQLICSHADLMIHHCGSGTYNYQIKYQVPAIILGSRCYDRDDVAKQLAQKNAAVFIPADLNDELWHEKLEKTITSLLSTGSEDYKDQKNALAALNLEMKQTSAAFNFGDIILKALKRPVNEEVAINA